VEPEVRVSYPPEIVVAVASDECEKGRTPRPIFLVEKIARK